MFVESPEVKVQQPRSLQHLLCNNIINLITDILITPNYMHGERCGSHLEDKKMMQLREYFQTFPVNVRFLLFTEGLSSVSKNKFFDNNYPENIDCLILTRVLVSSDMDRIDYVNLEYKWQDERTLAFILGDIFDVLSETQNLKLLALPLSASKDRKVKKINESLSNLLASNNSLTHLELPRLLSDVTLQVIGTSCDHLRFLDASYSKEITDHGICHLTQIVNSETKIAAVNGEMDQRFLEFYPSILGNNIKHLNHTNEEIVSYNLTVTRAKICQSLRALRLIGTNITEKGLTTLLVLVDNLKDVGFGMEKLFDRAFEICEQNEGNEIELPTWNLHAVHMNYLTENQLKMFRLICARSVTHLSVPIAPLPEDRFTNYFSDFGAQLTNLSLTRTFEVPTFHISLFLKQCPNLEKFQIKEYCGFKMKALLWGEEYKPVPIPTLKYVDLCTSVTFKAAEFLFKSATNLHDVNLGELTTGTGSNALLSLSHSLISKELKTFSICEGETLSNPKDVSAFWLCNQHIKKIGHVSYKVKDLGLGENIDLVLLPTKPSGFLLQGIDPAFDITEYIQRWLDWP